jgi:hypothetical protein
LVLIVVILVLSAVNRPLYIGAGVLEYFLVFGLPQAAIFVLAQRGAQRIAAAVAIGVAAIMTLLCTAWNLLGLLLASWNFGGHRVPDWYWAQWVLGCLLLVAQLRMGRIAVRSFRSSPRAASDAATLLLGCGLPLLYSVAAFLLLRRIV